MQSNALIASGRNKVWPSMLWTYILGGSVYQIVFSPNDQTVAACSGDNSITIFDAKTGVLEMRLRGHTAGVCTISFSPDGKRLASGSADESVIIWDSQSGEIVGKPLTGHSDTVTSVAYSPDGRFIASRSQDGEIRIWDAQSRAAVRVMVGCRGWGRLAYSHDGTKIACCGEEGIVVRDAVNGELLNKLSDIGYVDSVTYSQDGKYLASGGPDEEVHVRDATNLALVAKLKGHRSYVYSVIFTSDGTTLLSASNEGKMICWKISSFQMNGAALQESSLQSAACSSDYQLYASGSVDGSMRIWAASSHFNIGPSSESVNNRLKQVTCSPGGNAIASASSSGEICIHSFHSGCLLRVLRGHTNEVITVAFSPDGTLLASGSSDCTLRIWDVETGSELRRFNGHTGLISSVGFLPDGKQIFSSSLDRKIRLWNIGDEATGGELIHSHTSEIWSMRTSQNGGLLAFGDEDGRIQFVRISTRDMKKLQFEPRTRVRALDFSPDETHLASGSEDFIIRLWYLETKAIVRVFESYTSFVLSISFSRDGQRLLSSGGSGDSTIRQWNVDSGEEIRRLKGHTNAVCHSIYSDDEKHIISCSDDGTVRIWNADVEEVLIPEIDENLYSLKLEEGWIKSKTGELILWVPSEYRNGLKDMCERCISADAPGHPVRLDWSKLVGGKKWTGVLISGNKET